MASVIFLFAGTHLISHSAVLQLDRPWPYLQILALPKKVVWGQTPFLSHR